MRNWKIASLVSSLAVLLVLLFPIPGSASRSYSNDSGQSYRTVDFTRIDRYERRHHRHWRPHYRSYYRHYYRPYYYEPYAVYPYPYSYSYPRYYYEPGFSLFFGF